MRSLERACAFGASDGAGPSRTDQLGCALLTLRRFTRVALALALIGIAFCGVLTYRDLVFAPFSSCAAVVPGGGIMGQPPSVYGLVMCFAIAALLAYALARTRVDIGDEIMR